MARIRSIKPEFWTAEQVMECSPMARLLFIGMWNFCDDAGIHPASAKTLKAEVFPSDDITSGEVESLVAELVLNDLLLEYEVGGKKYLHVTGWSRHQKIEKPNFKHPKPDSTGNRRPVADQSPSDQRPVADQLPPEWSGDGVGEDVNPPHRSVATDSASGARDPAPPAALPAGPVDSDAKPGTTRRGLVCGLLRQAGIADAAPHHLTDETWQQILAKRTDEEIVEFAKAKLADRPGQRTGLKYLAPGLLDDPKTITPHARGSPSREDSRRIAAGTRLADYREACASEQQQEHDDERTIDATPGTPRLVG